MHHSGCQVFKIKYNCRKENGQHYRTPRAIWNWGELLILKVFMRQGKKMLTKQQIEIGGQGRQKEVSEHSIPGIKRTLLSLRFQRWNPFNDRSTPGGDRLTV